MQYIAISSISSKLFKKTHIIIFLLQSIFLCPTRILAYMLTDTIRLNPIVTNLVKCAWFVECPESKGMKTRLLLNHICSPETEKRLIKWYTLHSTTVQNNVNNWLLGVTSTQIYIVLKPSTLGVYIPYILLRMLLIPCTDDCGIISNHLIY